VLAGLCATLALLPILQRVLPALPISIAVGMFFYFTTEIFLSPLVDFAAGGALIL
jgi:presenilin 1